MYRELISKEEDSGLESGQCTDRSSSQPRAKELLLDDRQSLRVEYNITCAGRMERDSERERER